MPDVHPTAVLEGDISLADDVTIGPGCTLTGPITIGPGTTLIGHNYLTGPLTLGARNALYPFACLGFAPQDLKWDPQRPGAGLVVGDGNTFREHTTIHRATNDNTPTRIGSDNYFMVSSHIGHDSIVGNKCILANGTLVAGFVEIGSNVIFGGSSGVHQFCRIGRNSFVGGLCAAGKDVPPFFMLTGKSVCESLNLIGMRRSGMPSADIDDVKWVFRTLYRRGLSVPRALEEMEERGDHPIVRELIDFISATKRGICEYSTPTKARS
jgi:UDP-N-acetylglucosamine acyltransferase